MRVLLILLACLWPSLALATEQPDYLQSYKAYDAAMKAGNKETAAKEALRAWRLAQKIQDIDKGTLSILAQNYADLTLWNPNDNTLEALELSLKLDEDGFNQGAYTRQELALMAAFTANIVRGRQEFRPLNKAVNEALAADVDPLSDLMVLAKLQLVEIMISRGDHKRAYETITPLYHSLRMIEGIDRILIAKAALFRAASILNDIEYASANSTTNPFGVTDAYLVRVQNALVILGNARLLYDQPASSPDEIHPIALELAMWHSLAKTFLRTLETETAESWEFEGLEMPADTPPLFKTWSDECAELVVWDRKPMGMPFSALMHGYNGVAVVSYGFDSKGKTKDVRLVGELPERKFGDYAVKAAKGWSINAEELPAECLEVRGATFILSSVGDN